MITAITVVIWEKLSEKHTEDEIMIAPLILLFSIIIASFQDVALYNFLTK